MTTAAASVFDLPPRQLSSSTADSHQLLFKNEYHDAKILTNFCGCSIANGLKEYFDYLGVSATTIVETIDEGDVSRNILYIALFAFLYDFPPGLKYIAYQLDQKQQSAWFNDKYRKVWQRARTSLTTLSKTTSSWSRCCRKRRCTSPCR